MADKKNILEIALIPLVIAGVGFYISYQQQKNAEIMASADRQVKILEIFSEQIINSTKESERIFAINILAALDDELAAKLAQAVSKNENEPPGVRRAADQIVQETEARASSLPVVFLHILSEDNHTVAKKVEKRLTTDGYFIPRIVRPVEEGPAGSQVRYFKLSEVSEAKKIKMSLESIGVDVELQYISGYENSARIQALHFEVWIVQ